MRLVEHGQTLGPDQEWVADPLDCAYCEYDESGYIEKPYPHLPAGRVAICPDCGAGNRPPDADVE